MIRDQHPFAGGGKFYKGNLHCHSTLSDGMLTRAQLKEAYKSHGYDFISFTDHMRFVDSNDLEDEAFITLPGFEWDISDVCGDDRRYARRTHHILGIRGTRAMLEAAAQPPIEENEAIPRFPYEGVRTAQQMRQYLAERGFFAVYNHPVWSHVNPCDYGALEGYLAYEIFNNGCDIESSTGLSDMYWEDVLERGARLSAIATDDNHNRKDDSYGGFTMVKASELSREGLLQALADGRFYASSGPAVYDAYVEGGVVYVECSPCVRVNFRVGGFVCGGLTVAGEGITRATFEAPEKAAYVRVECVDARGRAAWLNPFYAEGFGG